jgi:hypothetical protein
MKALFALLLTSSIALSQNFTTSSAYHVNSNGTLLGASGAVNLKTWNDRKVIFRAVGGYYSGSTWSSSSSVGAKDRFELGLESRNTMVTGLTYFNILELGYQITQSRSQVGASIDRGTKMGLFFSIGLGVRVVDPVFFMVRYVTGFDNGVRLGIDYDF